MISHVSALSIGGFDPSQISPLFSFRALSHAALKQTTRLGTPRGTRRLAKSHAFWYLLFPLRGGVSNTVVELEVRHGHS